MAFHATLKHPLLSVHVLRIVHFHCASFIMNEQIEFPEKLEPDTHYTQSDHETILS